MTLVELIVAVAVGAIALTLIAITFVNGFTVQRDGVARDSATGTANVVASSIATSVRNATGFHINDEGTRVDATYIAPDGTPECRAWELLPGGALVYRVDASGALPAADSSWGKLATGVVGTLDNAKVFADDGGKSLRIGMEITMDQVTIAVTDGVTAQAVSDGGLLCWN
ncbi:type II secretory pathway pseudopilin PulG [Microbacterium invictum]|uniref:Type II secretory pathway pseudopilin PulG n=2 Tax=Microbacterium invictum TaxID=515415 RepID=A0AA40VMM0_9MICO|nr:MULTISPECIES: hypothetical protein [Microbacterium]MBB4139428.1 type II secretory pathway pseudopilin PulG [Microbacterium invictum]